MFWTLIIWKYTQNPVIKNNFLTLFFFTVTVIERYFLENVDSSVIKYCSEVALHEQ